MTIRRTARHVVSGIAALVAAGVLAEASADEHPGALWSITMLTVEEGSAAVAPARRAAVLEAIRAANETYYYGDLPARMSVRFVADGGLHLIVRDALSGAELVRSTALDGTGERLRDDALAWMDRLICDRGDCGVPADVAPVAATVPGGNGSAVTPVPGTGAGAAALNPDASGSGAIPNAGAATAVLTPGSADPSLPPVPAYPMSLAIATDSAVPVPQPKPGTPLARTTFTRAVPGETDLSGYDRITFSRLSARLDPDLSYGDADMLYLDGAGLMRRRTGTVPPQRAEADPATDTLLTRIVSDFLALFRPGSASSTALAAAPGSAAPAPASLGATSLSAPATALAPAPFGAPEATALAPAPLGATALTAPDASASLGAAALSAPTVTAPAATAPLAETLPRRSALALNARAAERRNTEVPVLRSEPFRPGAKWRLAASENRPGAPSDLPRPQEQFAALGDIDLLRNLNRPPETAVAEPEATDGTGTQGAVAPVIVSDISPRQTGAAPQLTVRLDPALFGGRSQAMLNTLLEARSERTVASAGGQTGAIATALAERGLVLDAANYASRERVYWSGPRQSVGFWISLPRFIDSGLVLIATENASVVANVRNRAGPVRISDQVAEAMRLEPDTWTALRIVALKRETEQGPTVAANQ